MENTITIIRKKGVLDYFRSYRITIDGKFIDYINDKPIIYRTDKSSIKLQSTIDWCLSNTQHIDFSETNNKTVLVENNVKDSIFMVIGLVLIIMGAYFDVDYLIFMGCIAALRLLYNLIFRSDHYLKISDLDELISKPMGMLTKEI